VSRSFDVAVIGGGVMGLSTAFHLLEREPGLKVAVIERDPTYERASTPRSAGGVRLQFSLPENVAMSAYGLAFYKTFGEVMAVDGEKPDIGLKQWGYLFLLPESARGAAEAMNAMQSGKGARNELLERDALARRFPSLALDDIALGSFGPEDGWTDPYAILMGFRRKVQAMGAHLIQDEALGIVCDGAGARAVALAGGEQVFADSFVCAAGAWSRESLERLPLTISPDGHYFRPEGAGYICGRSIEDEPEGENFEVDHGYFDEVLWPALAQRCPAFEALRLKNAWSGLYDINRLDENMIAGPHPEGPENLHVLCGFSGHGLQQAPAAGRAIAELILDRAFVSIDLSRLSCRRLVTGEAMAESGIV
jgi:FAD-dependent oxidoreductase domain-containing protein 1